ncbi:MAG: hypothetical protein QM736_26805 [Vicinamibacterales bacterium]
MRTSMVAGGLVLLVSVVAAAQDGAPRNDLPQPYRTTRDWGERPPSIAAWPAVTAVEVAPDGSIYVIERCHDNSCEGRSEPPILKYNAQGTLIAAWGEGLFNFPHGATVDAQGNLWATDARGGNGKGHQVIEFDPQGKVLMTLGRAGVSGSGPNLFDQPNDVLIAPNGDIFVADSHRNGRNNRIVRFDRNGRFLKEFGSKGSGRGRDQRATHDCDGLARAAVRRRSREQSHPDLRPGRQLSRRVASVRPAEQVYITKDDTIYVADSESGPDTGAHELTGIKKGIRIGSARDGRVIAFIEDMESTRGDHSGAEGLGVDAQGNVYGAVVRRQMLERHVRR